MEMEKKATVVDYPDGKMRVRVLYRSRDGKTSEWRNETPQPQELGPKKPISKKS